MRKPTYLIWSQNMAHGMPKVSKEVRAVNCSNILHNEKKDVTFCIMLSLASAMIGSGVTGWFFANTISQFFVSYSLLAGSIFIFAESIFWRFR